MTKRDVTAIPYVRQGREQCRFSMLRELCGCRQVEQVQTVPHSHGSAVGNTRNDTTTKGVCACVRVCVCDVISV